ncbi:MAG: HAD hydrolase-like protein [Calditrichaeota bacterium]|nr:HAD hydrolase-like protein [Calditrichota bacterium]
MDVFIHIFSICIAFPNLSCWRRITLKVLLFDIDGTLILSGGAGLRAINEAFLRLFDVPNAFANVRLAGRTDTSIIKDALLAHHFDVDVQAIEEFKKLYYHLLEREIETPLNGKKLMPGVSDLLGVLAEKKDVFLGLLTGNWEKSGHIKLSHFKIDHYFQFGAFADDSEIRNELLPFAIKRFSEKFGHVPDAPDVVVIGDTPADIQCARPHGATAVAVAAAHYTVEQLREYQPDHLFQDLSHLQDVLKVLT